MGSRSAAAQPFRGAKSREEFVAEIGNIWIGLIEQIASEPDQVAALAGYFGVQPEVIADWIKVRGRTRCSAEATRGGRCANLVGTQVEYDPRLWAEIRALCSSHAPGR